MTRISKIARLPHHIRNQLNQRLQDGEQGKTLVEWLNALPMVQETLKEQFGGRAVNEQNLSDWRQGGYQDWLRHEESRGLIESLTEQHDELEAAADGLEISDRYAGLLSVEFVALTRKMLEEKTDPMERWKCLREVLQELTQLRRDDHRAVRTAIKRDRWNRETEAAEAEASQREIDEAKSRAISQLMSMADKGLTAQAFGGGNYGKQMADLLHAIKFPSPLPPAPPTPATSDATGSDGETSGPADQGQSSLIKPNQA